MTWTPETTFAASYAAAALSGMAVELLGDRPLSARMIAGTILLYGGLGSGLGMIGFVWFGGEKQPWRVIACAMLVGVRAIQLKEIRSMLARLLDIKNGKH